MILCWLRALLAAVPLAAGAAALPEGSWDVVRLTVDPHDQPHWLYRPDDPRLVGRTLDVTADVLVFDEARCERPRWDEGWTRWSTLLERDFGRIDGSSPAPSQFGLGKDERVRLLRPRCTPPSPGRRVHAPWDDTWIARRADGSLVLRHGPALLFLAPRRDGVRLRPSFACAAALAAAEAAICADAVLAGWDRSVAIAYAEALRRRPDRASALHGEQRVWLATRDGCAADAACLQRAMRERVDDLVAE
jgi:uncharacterized protein YecT (DUF1311 family)